MTPPSYPMCHNEGTWMGVDDTQSKRAGVRTTVRGERERERERKREREGA